MMLRFISTALATGSLAVLLFPSGAQAYLNPYDVLLADDLLLPSQPRSTMDRVDRQQSESAARREREQEAIFAEQHPNALADVAPDVEMDQLHSAAPDEYAEEDDGVLSPEEREFNSLLRALERIKGNQEQAKVDAQVRQQAFILLGEAGIQLDNSGLHGGAPILQGKGSNLAPTGAGSVLAMLVLFFAGLWTIRRVQKAQKQTNVLA